MADESNLELERLDPESEACFAALRDCIRQELFARSMVGDDPRTPEGQTTFAELIADRVLDCFSVRERTSARYRWREK